MNAPVVGAGSPSLYVHVPFCRRACTYCNFHFSTQLDQRDAVVDAMVAELTWTARHASDLRVTTLYAGGGTPSVLTEAHWNRWMEAFYRLFSWTPGGEMTLEVNPEDVTPEQLNVWRSLGFNRFSLGVQTFDDRDLSAMNRFHSGEQARRAIQMAQDAGFENLSMDLMYGLPFGSWEETWDQALAMRVPHLSAYALTVEAKTALAHAVRTGAAVVPSDETVAQQARDLRKQARSAGWKPYEVSNLAQPGWEAVHNSRYWTGAPYWGIGPGAHGFDGGMTRRANVANNAVYVRRWLQNPEPPGPWDAPDVFERPAWEVERLTPNERWNEWVMTSLRTARGLVWAELPASLRTRASELRAGALPALTEATARGWLVESASDAGFEPTDLGWQWSDRLAEELFLID